MADLKTSLSELVAVDGAKAAAVVDSDSGMVLGTDGGGLDLDVAGAGNTEVVRAKLKTMKALGLKDSIDDILITLSTQYHIIRPLPDRPQVFIYHVLDKSKANLALARLKAAEVAKALTL